MSKTCAEHDDEKMDAAQSVTVDPDEVAFFARIADSWWDPNGPFRPLHQLNPTRLSYIRQQAVQRFGRDDHAARPLADLRLLDIGCGGGLIAEPMARLGAAVTAIDASAKNIGVARHHAMQSDLKIDYRHMTAEQLADMGETFDVVVNMEVVEHVADVDAYLQACAALVKPGGIMLVSTLNRTSKAWLFAIVGAEYVLRWLPVGAHDWKKFLTPAELSASLKHVGFMPDSAMGFAFSPFSGRWRLDPADTAVNYAMAAMMPSRP